MTPALIATLERLARSPALPPEAVLDRLALNETQAEALHSGDARALARAFGEHRTLWCIVEIPEEHPKPGEEGPDHEPDRDPQDIPDDEPGPGR